MFKRFFIGIAAGVITFSFTTLAVSGWDKKKKDELYREVQLFSSTLAIIQSDYVDEVKPKDMIYGALSGMLSSLDPHSQFMDPDTYNELKVDTEGKFGGLGIEITSRDGLLTVVTPLEDTPAWKAGIKAQDRIVKINNELTRDMTLTDAVKRLRGKPGDPVNITVLRESENKLLDFKIVRDTIKIVDIKEARILEDGIGYMRLVEFRENTARNFSNAFNKLHKQGMRAFILDLRNNPGGLLDDAVKVAENFIKKGGMIVYTKSKNGQQNLEFIAGGNKPELDLPMVVMINAGSASGSEIVAGALQDYKRAIIVGTKSFGKGSVQTVIPLSDGSALRLTTSRYFTPLGRSIHEKGIEPDIVVEEARIEPEAVDAQQPLNSKEIFDKIEKNKGGKEDKDKADAFDYKSDRQINSAIDALKAVLFYRQSDKK